MKKSFILLSVCLLGFAAFAQAQSYSSSEPNDPVAQKIGSTIDTQSQSLGLQNFQTENAFNIWLNPAQITVWQTVYGEVWGGTTWGGMNKKTDFGYFGVFVGRPYDGAAGGFGDNADDVLNVQSINWGNTSGPAAAAVTGTATTINLAPLGITANNIDILYGKVFGNMSFGARLSMANNTSNTAYDYTNPDAASNDPTAGDGSVSLKKESTDMELGLGLLFKEVGPFTKLDVAATFSQPKVNNTFAQSRIETTGALDTETASDKLTANNSMNMKLLVRGIMSDSLIATFGYQAIDVSANREFSADDTPTIIGDDLHTTQAYNDKTTNMLLDAAFHQNPAENLKVIYTVGYRSSSRTGEVLESNLDLSQAAATTIGPVCWEQQKTDYMAIPVSVAIEHQTWSKVCTRLGVQKSIFDNTKTTTKNQNYRDLTADAANTNDTVAISSSKEITVNPTAATATVTLGLGIQPLKDFSIDLALVANAYNFSTIISRGSIRYHF